VRGDDLPDGVVDGQFLADAGGKIAFIANQAIPFDDLAGKLSGLGIFHRRPDGDQRRTAGRKSPGWSGRAGHFVRRRTNSSSKASSFKIFLASAAGATARHRLPSLYGYFRVAFLAINQGWTGFPHPGGKERRQGALLLVVGNIDFIHCRLLTA
jgi:hypothetical protein